MEGELGIDQVQSCFEYHLSNDNSTVYKNSLPIQHCALSLVHQVPIV